MNHLESVHGKERKEILDGDYFNRLKQFFSPEQSETRLRLILFIGLAAIALIFLSDNFSGKTRSASANVSTNAADYGGYGDYDQYTEQLEARLTELISAVDGAGETKVMITLECGTEYVYASQQKTTSAMSENSDANGKTSRDEKRTGEENVILVDGSGGEEPLILKEITPTVAGVVVVCSGADDVNVRQRVTDIVTTALGTSSNRVCVTRMGS